MDKCSHTYCKDCWRENINSKLNRGNVNKIKCLDYCCTEECSEALCKEILSPEVFDKYIRFTHAFVVDTNKHMIFCPNDKC